MIKETSKKIHFIPFSPVKGKEVDTSPTPTVTISRKYHKILVSKHAVRECGMENKFVRFYFEPVKKIIGWQIRQGGVSQEDMKTWKLCKPVKAGMWPIYAKKLLNQFDGRLTKMLYEGLPIQKYREANPLSEYKGQIFYFVELVDNPEELKKGVGNNSLQELVTA